ncbi:MAG TPA: class I SAM-dependent methyltransferase [Polyangia bacterium]|nr:class I SAM-dependent methyltransferase [Polyangia bacterium]
MTAPYKLRTHCALCAAPQGKLRSVLQLAATPPANEFVREEERGTPQDLIPLTLQLCEVCGHLQLAEIADPRRLFQHYVYVSGTSSVFVAHFARFAAAMADRFALGPTSLVVDVGSNDGTLLKQFQALGIKKVLGVDPAVEIVKEAVAAGVPTREGFFTPAVAADIRATHGAADLLCANNVFAHAEDLAGFARGVQALLGDEGVFVFEVSYLVDVIQKLLFDTIYHEHVAYHALTPLVRFFDGLGLRLFDAERVDTHGGSVRCYVAQRGSKRASTDRLAGLLKLETELGLFGPEVYAAFKQRITDRGRQLRDRLREIKAKGGRIAGFGAPAKLTTLMYEFGLDQTMIDFIVDDSAWKQGKFTPGTHIPVVPATQLAERRPDACVVFAWNFADSIIKKHETYSKTGGRFIVPLPELREL